MTEQQVSDYIAGKIRAARKDRGWSTDDLAERCGLTGNMIENIESGRRDHGGRRRRAVTVDELVVISEALDVGVLDLMPGKTRPSPSSREREIEAYRRILAEDESAVHNVNAQLDYLAAEREQLVEKMSKTRWLLEQLQSGN